MKHKVLVVDDDQNLLESYKFLLSVSGFEPLLALNSKEAMDFLKKNNISVALVDLKLKGEDGLSLIQSLKKDYPKMEIILITAYPSYETAVEAIKLGAFDYLSKTQDPEEILEVIKNAIENSISASLEEQITDVVVIANNSFIRKGIEVYLERNNFKIVSAFKSLRGFLENYSEGLADIILICGNCFFDKTIKNFPLLRELVKKFSDEKIVIFNYNFSDKQIKELLKIGVKGFISPNTDEQRFVNVLNDIIQGKIVAPESAIISALAELSKFYAHNSVSNLDENTLLTEREREILKLMAKGMKNKELAEKLCISEKTVKTHINRIFKKLNVKSRLQAIIKATELDLLF